MWGIWGRYFHVPSLYNLHIGGFVWCIGQFCALGCIGHMYLNHACSGTHGGCTPDILHIGLVHVCLFWDVVFLFACIVHLRVECL